MRVWSLFGVALGLALTCAASAQIDIGTTDASDGDLSVVNWPGVTLDLSQAATGTWDMPSPVPGKGVYDPVMWAVVYKFNNVNISQPFGFLPHPSGCPVVILVQGNVTINTHFGVPNTVGGFRGALPGSGAPGSAGLGLGGGQATLDRNTGPGPASYGLPGSDGGYSALPVAPTYGNPSIIPLVGGSGAGSIFERGGMPGGGAIMIACRNTINVNASIGADAGTSPRDVYPASGGAIRLVANTVAGNGAGALYARGGQMDSLWTIKGGDGRIRIEANTFGNYGTANPAPSLATVGPVAKLWPSNTDPKVTVLNVNNVSAPADPSLPFSGPDINLTTPGNMVVQVQAMNVPTDGSWSVTVRGAPRVGQATVYPCTFVSGNQALSVWQCTIPFTEGLQVIQARARRN